MASTRELRRRLKSVKSTRQITKAMELVAASKMRRASDATLASRPYSSELWQIVLDISTRTEQELVHPLLEVRPVEKSLAIIISSDRGLAGAYNTSVLKQTLQFERQQKQAGKSVDFITLGKKVESSLARLGVPILQSYPHVPTHPSTGDILPISRFVTEAYLQKQYDQVVIIATNFISMLRQEVEVMPLLPLQPELPAGPARQSFLYEPSPEAVMDVILPRLVETRLYQSLLESLASEHSSRRMAMKSATDNASTLVDDLTLTYNSVRQSMITQEIAEITSGVAALSS